MEQKNKILKIQDVLIYYFICSIIGWILEMIYGYAVYGHFVDRGFLYGPMCPIYGCGVILMVIIAEYFKEKDINAAMKFIIITVMFTMLEYISSFVLEALFNQTWWDYTNEILNLQGRVCIIFSLMFGIMGIIFMEFVYEPSKKLINKIREKISAKLIWILLTIGIVIYVLDTALSVIKNVNV